LSALKILQLFTLDPHAHVHLLQSGCTEPLIECIEVCQGQALVYALRSARALASSGGAIRTHLVRCHIIPSCCNHMDLRKQKLGEVRWLALDILRNIAKDSSVAPILVGDGAVS
jgi:hypothetical protein